MMTTNLYSDSEFNQIFEDLEAPDYPATCDQCGAEGTNASMEAHICLTREEADLVAGAIPLQALPSGEQCTDNCYFGNHGEPPAPRAGERDEWEYRETRYGAEARAGRFAIRLHWTGLADIGDIRATIRKIVTEHNQHAILTESPCRAGRDTG